MLAPIIYGIRFFNLMPVELLPNQSLSNYYLSLDAIPHAKMGAGTPSYDMTKQKLYKKRSLVIFRPADFYRFTPSPATQRELDSV